MNIYEYKDYASYIEAIIKQGSWGIHSQIAKAAKCQASYLSQVIRGKSHLTTDHVIGIAYHLKLSIEETEFFLKLVEYEKAGCPVRATPAQKGLEFKSTNLLKVPVLVSSVFFSSPEFVV